MRWKSALISSCACLGALRGRLRSLCTAQRSTGTLRPDHVERAAQSRIAVDDRRAAAPSGRARPDRRGSPSTRRTTRCRTSSSETSCFVPSVSTATAASTGVAPRGSPGARAARSRRGTGTPHRDRRAALAPLVERALERLHHARHRAARQRRLAQKRAERALEPARVRAREVHARDRLVDLRHPSLVARQQLRAPLVLAPFLVEDHAARHAHRERPALRRQRPRPRPVSIAAPLVAALVLAARRARAPAPPATSCSTASRTQSWISTPSVTGSSSRSRSNFLVRSPMAHSSGGRPARRLVGC